MLKNEELIRIQTELDYIHSVKDQNSLKAFLYRYPYGAPDSVICKILCITQEELDLYYKSAILALQGGFINGKIQTTE